ncbi:hypothetical protein Tco_1209472 [Tanacetum coccineum]
MANIRTCNKHNMIACVEKTAQNADFYQIIDFLTGCSINYSLLVDPDLIGPWLQQFWATASLKVINDVPHIRAKVAGKKILISEATIRADLLFDDENGVDCFPKQVIWDLLRDIGYEGNLAQLTFSKPLFSPQWKYLVHVLLHCLSPKSTSWEQFDVPNIASASRISTNQNPATLNGLLKIQRTTDFKDASQTSGGDEGLLDIYALNREVRRLKKQTLSQAKQILKLKAKLKKLSKFVQPVVKHHAFWVENQNLKKQKRRRKKHKKKVSSVKLGRNKDEGTLSEEHYVQEEDTAHPFFDDIVDKDAAVNPDLERKSDETEEVNIEEKEASNVKSGETEELDLETTQILVAISRPKRFEHSWSQTISPPKPGKVTDTQALEKLYKLMRRLLEKFKSEWDAEEERNGEDGTMIHMLAERRYPLSRELMIRMLDHGMEVEDETETAITLIHLFILWTTEDGDNS